MEEPQMLDWLTSEHTSYAVIGAVSIGVVVGTIFGAFWFGGVEP